MYLRLEIATTGLRSLFWQATGHDRWHLYDLDRPSPRCALCGAREYPSQFPLPHPWPRLHEVVTSITEEQDGKRVAVLTGDGGESLYLPVEDAEMLGDTVYRYRFCRYHGRPETALWIDCLTAIPIEWFPERLPWQQRLFNFSIRISYILRVTGRFLWSLVTFRFISIRITVKEHPWQT